MTSETPKRLTTRELAGRTGVTVRTINTWALDGIRTPTGRLCLPRQPDGYGGFTYDPEQVDEFLAATGRAARVEAGAGI